MDKNVDRPYNDVGVYLHIPFCKQACHYCNFHFSTNLRLKDQMVSALCREIEMRQSFLDKKNLSSIYFGGGTPSLLEPKDFDKIFEALSRHFSWSKESEITLEANPDDLTTSKIKAIKNTPVNRFSIGIQSFSQMDLDYMNRAHSADQAENSIKDILNAGWTNISIDLIYGTPTMTDELWQNNIEKALYMNIPHVSAYALTIEEKTALYYKINKKGWERPKAEDMIRQYDLLMDMMNKSNYKHYEISNFALPGYRAIHNSHYWSGGAYLGIGPGAHSYDGDNVRSWNIAHNPKYIKAIHSGILPIEKEILTATDKYNEYVMVSLRTSEGVCKSKLTKYFPQYSRIFHKVISDYIESGDVYDSGEAFILTNRGKYRADGISRALMVV